MTTFFLHYGNTETSFKAHAKGLLTVLPDPREFLDTHEHKESAAVVKTIEAASWLDARLEIPG